jgi:hypothetical protein
MIYVTKIHRVSKGLVRAESCDPDKDYGQQFWVQIKARKAGECVVTKQPYNPGDLVYRPVGNPQNKNWRVCTAIVDLRAAKTEKSM